MQEIEYEYEHEHEHEYRPPRRTEYEKRRKPAIAQ
jgi:hypothetical protein